jgi:multicomponent Na+:H+ antiporter subunit D
MSTVPDAVVELATSSGFLLVLILVLPFAAVLLALVLGGRNPRRVAFLTLVTGLGLAIAIALALARGGQPLIYLLGNWAPPLGVALRADGLSVTMLLTTVGVILGVAIYARNDFTTPPGGGEERAPLMFWILLMAVWGSLNLIFLAGDLFTLYVALELVTFAGVPLVCLDGRPATLQAALRYLLFALVGSVLYMLGAVLLYGAYGTLDIALLAQRVRPEAAAYAAAALMTGGLLAKTALFPLHLWLPPAHAGAPAAASAVLSALVVKGSWFLVVRLWFDVMPGVVTFSAAQVLGALGAGAIVLGSVVALRQERLKLLVAYSTMAQIGYLFLMFPLAFDATGQLSAPAPAVAGGLLQVVSHATAKAGMFMAAGLIYAALGHDRIGELAGVGRAMPVATLALAVAGVALMGVLPSGAYVAKKLMLDAADASGQWWWTLVLQGGAVFTAGYVVLTLFSVMRRAPATVRLRTRVSPLAEWVALALSLASLLLVFAVPAIPEASPVGGLASETLAMLVALGLGGALLVYGLSTQTWGGRGTADRPLRRAGAALGALFAGADDLVRRWSTATASLLLLVMLLGGLLLAGQPG